MTISTISVSDMHCAACSSKIRQALAGLQGIHAAHINPAKRMVFVDHDQTLSALELLRQIESAGFSPALAGGDDHDAVQRVLLKRLGIAGLAMMQVMMAAFALYAGAFNGMEPAYVRLLELTSLIFCIPVVCYSAVPFFRNALSVLANPGRGINMDVPIALAIAIAFTASLLATVRGTGDVYYDSVVMFTFLLLGARYIDNRLRRRFDASSSLLAALPAFATRLRDGTRESISVAAIRAGDQIRVGEGEQVPVDGVLISTLATLDEALLTGESDWVRRSAGDAVYAGTLNRGASFEIRATAAYERSRIADIAALADRAEIRNAPSVQLADRVAAVFVPGILTIAALTFVVWSFIDPDRALLACLTVLVVSCPCALSLATPATLTAAMSRLRQFGIVLTRSSALEEMLKIDRVFFDKTGTLTLHEPTIQSIEILDPTFSKARCLALAASLQQYSAHPYARAFATRAFATRAFANPGRGSNAGRTGAMGAVDPVGTLDSVEILDGVETLDSVETVTGQGVRGLWHGRSVKIGSPTFAGSEADVHSRAVYLAVDGLPRARFTLSDQIREDALGSVTALKSLGIEPVMLSGDADSRCAETAAELDIGYLARQTPESKLAHLDQQKADGHQVLMVGDGINDVPVLARADVSVAVVEASDLVKSKADVLLLTRRLGPLVDLFTIARTAGRITRQNMLWALIYNGIAIPVAALGFMPPWLAALGMASSSTLVMLNASRLLHTPAFGER
ncbi:MAG: cation-translocating P-type ATPase [Pseudomonadales bacterium]